MKVWHKRRTVHQVTDARPSLTEDIGKREKNYLIKMGIRLACLILAFTVPAPLPVRLLLFAGAIFLPYVAVIGANAPQKGAPVDSDMHETGQSEIPRHRREIGS
ncbi:DUF3099 domain-containing protein [Streptosporangium pseudovulgare]|uniref:DUF3099 domain-containing protein n=1 Tax=Streptosporangium pseudovulgare TaxID=35765 RepID=A0ABQ2R9K4_9ACTN|nr:DUF3099 domain-containing protein [Streptosporangium pseudovulgare]GGQ15855.1 hypothetical protein GCM10010140_52690 [Streptosporangium pseudovulgare]